MPRGRGDHVSRKMVINFNSTNIYAKGICAIIVPSIPILNPVKSDAQFPIKLYSIKTVPVLLHLLENVNTVLTTSLPYDLKNMKENSFAFSSYKTSEIYAIQEKNSSIISHDK